MRQAYPFLNHSDMQRKPRVGISACLCGDAVRYDGQSKWQPELLTSLGGCLELEKICPEVAIGMGIPRPPIQLSRDSGTIQAVDIANPDKNFSVQLNEFADQLVTAQRGGYRANPLCGYIFKSRSPSCGVNSTPIHINGVEVGLGSGIVAQRVKQQLPWMPVLEETDLQCPEHIQRFIFLTHLVNDFWHPDNCVEAFHRHHDALHQHLPDSTQEHLAQLAGQPAHAQDYLASLITTLLNSSPAELEIIEFHESQA